METDDLGYPRKAKIETRGTVASSQAFDIARGMLFFRLNGRGRYRPCWPVLAASKEDIRTVRGRERFVLRATVPRLYSMRGRNWPCLNCVLSGCHRMQTKLRQLRREGQRSGHGVPLSFFELVLPMCERYCDAWTSADQVRTWLLRRCGDELL